MESETQHVQSQRVDKQQGPTGEAKLLGLQGTDNQNEENSNMLETVPNFSALTTPAPKIDFPKTIEGEVRQTQGFNQKPSLSSKIKRIASTNDQLDMAKNQKSKAISKCQSSMKLKSPESLIKSRQAKDKRRRGPKAGSIQSKSAFSDGSSTLNAQSKAPKKKSLSICKQPSQQQAQEISGDLQSSGKLKESDTACKNSSPDTKKVSEFGVFMVSKSHFYEADVSKCLCTMRRLKLSKMMRHARRPTRKNSKRVLEDVNTANKLEAKTKLKIHKSKSLLSPKIKVSQRRSTRNRARQSLDQPEEQTDSGNLINQETKANEGSQATKKFQNTGLPNVMNAKDLQMAKAGVSSDDSQLKTLPNVQEPLGSQYVAQIDADQVPTNLNSSVKGRSANACMQQVNSIKQNQKGVVVVGAKSSEVVSGSNLNSLSRQSGKPSSQNQPAAGVDVNQQKHGLQQQFHQRVDQQQNSQQQLLQNAAALNSQQLQQLLFQALKTQQLQNPQQALLLQQLGLQTQCLPNQLQQLQQIINLSQNPAAANIIHQLSQTQLSGSFQNSNMQMQGQQTFSQPPIIVQDFNQFNINQQINPSSSGLGQTGPTGQMGGAATAATLQQQNLMSNNMNALFSGLSQLAPGIVQAAQQNSGGQQQVPIDFAQLQAMTQAALFQQILQAQQSQPAQTNAQTQMNFNQVSSSFPTMQSNPTPSNVQTSFIGGGFLGDLGGQANLRLDADLGPPISQFGEVGFDKSADSHRQNFGLYDADQNAMHPEHWETGGLDQHDFLANLNSQRKEDSDDLPFRSGGL